MAVAKDQIAEILKIATYYIPYKDARRMLIEMRKTQAYLKNKSFRDTIERMLKEGTGW